MIQTQEAKPSLDSILNQGSDDWCMEAIRQQGDEFTAFIRTKHGKYELGTFKTRPEAEQAIKDALEARFNG